MERPWLDWKGTGRYDWRFRWEDASQRPGSVFRIRHVLKAGGNTQKMKKGNPNEKKN